MLIHTDYTSPSSFITFASKLFLKSGEVHEACGPARIRFAILVGAATKGTIIWIRPKWDNTIFNSDGISCWFSPKRLLLIKSLNMNDLLYSVEESLRSGVAPLVIAELPKVPKLTPMRRLNLASKTISKNNELPVCIILTPNEGGATSIASRWFISSLPCDKVPNNFSPSISYGKWKLSRLFSKTEPQAQWTLEAVYSTNYKKILNLILTPLNE